MIGRLLGRPRAGLDGKRVRSFLAANPGLYVDLPGRPHQRREPGWMIPWWWVGPDRVVVAAGPGLVVATRPTQTSGHLTLESCAKLTLIGMAGPPPGAVQLAHQATLTLTADRFPVDGPWGPRPGHEQPEPTLTSLVGRRIRLEAEGRANPGGSATVARGVVAEAGVLEHHVVVCLEDGTLAVVHRPAKVEAHLGGVVVAGQFERVVLDVPGERSLAVARPGRLVINFEVSG